MRSSLGLAVVALNESEGASQSTAIPKAKALVKQHIGRCCGKISLSLAGGLAVA